MMEETQKNVEMCVTERISEAVEKERAHHGEKMEQLQFLLKENFTLWEEKDALMANDDELCFEMDGVKKDLDKVKQEILIREKVKH